MRRASLFWGALSLLLPACSLLFDGSSYRPVPGGDAGTCTVASCGLGQRCDLTTGACASGCDEDDDCPGDELCDVATNMCDGFTGCIEDTDCLDSEYCDEVGECVSCDADNDGWAPVGAPVRCVMGPVVGLNDCGPINPAIHPLALPDCSAATNDTCEAEAPLARLLAGDGIELGSTALSEVTAPQSLLPGSLRVHVLATSGTETSLLVLAQLNDMVRTPVFQVVPLRAEPFPGMRVLMPLAMWDTTNTTQFAVGSMSLGAMGVTVVVVERQADGQAIYRFVRVGADGTVMPAASQDVDVGGGTVESIRGLAVGRNGPERPVVALLDVVAGGSSLLVALQAASQGRPTAPSPGLTTLDGRSFAAYPQMGEIGFWNGDSTPAFASSSFMMSARPAFASSPTGTTLGLVINTSRVSTFAGNCAAPATSLDGCVTNASGTIGFGMDLAMEPLASADWASGNVFGLSGRLPLGAGILFSLVTAPGVTPYGSGGLVLPVPTVTRPFVQSATDADLGIHTVAAGGTGRIAAGYGIVSGSAVRVMALHVCVGALP